METNTKYLSYFWNTADQEKDAKLNIIHRKLNEQSALGLFLNVLFCFAVVTSVAFGLRSIETNLFPSANAADAEHLFVMPAMAAELTFQAELTNQSDLTTYIKPKDASTFTLKLKNTGTATWSKDTVFLKSSTTAFKFSHKNWLDLYLPAKLNEKTVEPGAIGTFTLTTQAPLKLNNYSGEFLLVQDNTLIPGGQITLTLNVVEDPIATKLAAEPPPVVSAPNNAQPMVCSLKLRIANDISSIDNGTCAMTFGFPATGPQIRVGLFTIDQITSIRNDRDWEIFDINNLLASVPADQIVDFYFNKTKQQYSFDFNGKTYRTTSYLSLKNTNAGVFEITSLKDSPSWNKTINYNHFNGNLEIRYNTPNNRAWLIESLPMEEYVQGINETTNSDPIEYLKAMATAARTYALYHVNTGKKHASEFFDVDSYNDQVYKGYEVRLKLSHIAEAAQLTAGMVATYNNEIIVAPYFSRSDGATRSYKAVWKKDIPYLQSVATPYTKGKTLWGHGVGIDATDALNRAKKDSWTFDQILKYYYTGITLEKIY